MLSNREKVIAIGAGAAVVLLGLNFYVLDPLLNSRADLYKQKAALSAKIEQTTQTLAKAQAAQRRWKDFHAAGLVADAPTTESNLLNAMRTMSQEAGLQLQSIRPDRVSGNEGLHELTFQVTADGSMRAIAGFMYRIESAAMPVRIHEVQLASRTEGSDDLTLQLRISTLWEDPKSPTAAGAAPPAAVAPAAPVAEARDSRAAPGAGAGARPRSSPPAATTAPSAGGVQP